MSHVNIEYPYQLIEVGPLAKDIFKVVLAPNSDQILNYQAGQYIECCLPQGETCVLSIANRPTSNHQLIFHLKIGPYHEQTEKFLTYITQNKTISLRGPYGTATLPTLNKTKPLLFVAGGTGFSQIKALLEEAFYQGCQQPLILTWGLTHECYEYDQEWLALMAATHLNFSYHKIIWQPENIGNSLPQGLVHEFIANHFNHLNDFIIFASGPYNMIQAIKNLLIQQYNKADNLISDML